MEKFTIVDVIKAFEVMRALRAVNGLTAPEGVDDPLHPVWVKELERIVAQLDEVYLKVVRSNVKDEVKEAL